MKYKDITISDVVIRVDGEISEVLNKHIDNYISSELQFNLYDFVEYLNKVKYVKGYRGGKETKENNPYEYIIYI